MEFSKLQREILDKKDKKIVVMASAASGKSALITEKTRQILRSGIDPKLVAVITFTNMAAEELRKRLGEDYKDGIYIGTVHGLANNFLLSNGIDTSRCLKEEDFDKLFSLVKQNVHCIKEYSYVLLDEAQDSGDLEFEFIFDMINPEHFFVAGDLKQCQPKGTKVLLADNTEKNIEDLQIGDNVMSYDSSGGRISGGTAYNSKPNIVEKISSRELSDEEELIEVHSEDGKISRYTGNHKTFAMLNRYDEYNFITYLMCDKNDRFRVGTSQFKNSNNCPWKGKVLAEGCIKFWILDVFKTNREARILEDKVSYLYQIPQLTFQLSKTTYEQIDIDYIYEGLDTRISAEKCLKAFGRDILYPFYEKNSDIHYAGNAFNIVYACNLLEHNMQIMSFKKGTKRRRESINISKIVRIKETKETVYSLKISPNEAYIADGIVTHNSIYGFKGSKPELLFKLSRQPDVTSCSLNENYRNGHNILQYAKRIIRPTGMIDDSIALAELPGSVFECSYGLEKISTMILKDGNYGNWAVLTRTNAEISDLIYVFSKMGIPYDTFKQSKVSKDELNKKMTQDTVKVLTIHSAKGLEWENVAVIGTRTRPDEEKNVCYVAATRAKQRLIWMGGKPKKSLQPKSKTRVYNWG